MRDEGLVRHIGVSSFSVPQLRRAQAIAPVETLQPRYSLIARGVEDGILPFAEGEGIGVIVYSPMGSGTLSGGMTLARIERLPDDDWRKHDARFREPLLSEHLALVERLRAVGRAPRRDARGRCRRLDVPQPAVNGAIVGFRGPGRVRPIVAAASLELSDADVNEIEEGLR